MPMHRTNKSTAIMADNMAEPWFIKRRKASHKTFKAQMRARAASRRAK